ncbi:radical SAM/SPASM domain-containing protein [Longibaculum muris]|uniref:radical SAM/SPASM domain-containing protein n=1 Tax=Longibaculum muris TaxID=1796628 RepID=UPI00189CDBF1|nr:radical SAM protein [Longibaculum muris]
MEYKESKFNMYVKHHNQNFIFNTMHGSLIQVDAQELPILEHFHQELVDHGFIIPNDFDEIEYLKQKRIKAISNKDALYVRILTTSFCNARCYYCYEQGLKQENMSEDTAIDIAKFICSISQETKFLNICWFGGEPLLNPHVISIIINYIKEHHINQNLKIVSSFITNGSLINDEIIYNMVNNWYTRDIQISMDGYGNEYNLIKNYVNPNYNFDLVVENIKKLIKTPIKIRVRLNINRENFEESKQLINYFEKVIGHPQNFKIYPGFLFDGENNNNKQIIHIDEFTLKKDFADYLNNHGYSCTLSTQRRNLGCYAGRIDNFLITPNGQLYKCAQHYADKKSHCLGDIYHYNDIDQKQWIQDDLPSKCFNCICLPLCQGGCKAARNTHLHLQVCHTTPKEIEYSVHLLIDKMNDK